MSVLVVGLPTLPACTQAVIGEPSIPKPYATNALDFWAVRKLLGIGPKLRAEIQYRLYNTWQVMEVLDQNTPGKLPQQIYPASPENGYRASYVDGLEFFRDSFFQFYASTPENERFDAQGRPLFLDDIQKGIDKNDLTLISYSNQLGALRFVGSVLQNMKRDDPGLEDFMNFLLHLALSPSFDPLVRDLTDNTVASGGVSGRSIFWNLLEQSLETIHSKSNKDSFLFPMAGILNQVQPWTSLISSQSSREPDLLEKVLSQFRSLISVDENRHFLAYDANELLKDLLISKTTVPYLSSTYAVLKEGNEERVERWKDLLTQLLSQDRSLLQSGLNLVRSIYSDPVQAKNLRTFKSSLENLFASAEYRALQSSEVEVALLPILHFFEERELDAHGLARQLRLNLASTLNSHDWNELFLFANQYPHRLKGLLQVLQKYLGQGEEGEFKEFLEMIQRRLSSPRF